MYIHGQSQKHNQVMTSISFELFPASKGKSTNNITLQLSLDPPPERGYATTRRRLQCSRIALLKYRIEFLAGNKKILNLA